MAADETPDGAKAELSYPEAQIQRFWAPPNKRRLTMTAPKNRVFSVAKKARKYELKGKIIHQPYDENNRLRWTTPEGKAAGRFTGAAHTAQKRSVVRSLGVGPEPPDQPSPIRKFVVVQRYASVPDPQKSQQPKSPSPVADGEIGDKDLMDRLKAANEMASGHLATMRQAVAEARSLAQLADMGLEKISAQGEPRGPAILTARTARQNSDQVEKWEQRVDVEKEILNRGVQSKDVKTVVRTSNKVATMTRWAVRTVNSTREVAGELIKIGETEAMKESRRVDAFVKKEVGHAWVDQAKRTVRAFGLDPEENQEMVDEVIAGLKQEWESNRRQAGRELDSEEDTSNERTSEDGK